MNPPLQLVAIVGSLRADSTNRSVMSAAMALLPDGVEMTEIPLADVPLYDGDIEAGGDPESVAQLKASVEAADALVVFTPEYNRSIPAVTKNAIDWLSRMPGDNALLRSTVGIVAATPGRHEAMGVRGHLATSIGAVTDKLYDVSHGIASVTRAMTDGRLTGDEAIAALGVWLNGFIEFVRAGE